jgi:ABC-type glycerol-3-phosphate transport system permease component
MKKHESFIIRFVQISTLISDILILLACFFVMITVPVLGIILTAATYYTWKTTGGFITWTKSKQFRKNFKEMMEAKRNGTKRR